MNLAPADRDRLLEKILNTAKYRESGLNPQTVLDLIDEEAPRQTSEKALYKAVRRKLVLEIGGGAPVQPPRAIPAQITFGEPYDCLVGEKIWRRLRQQFFLDP